MKLVVERPEILNDLITRINELYHDFENIVYDERHSHRLRTEVRLYKTFVLKYVTQNKPLVLLDHGTGTGYIPLVLGSHLKPTDTLICVDVSQKMLDVCQDSLRDHPCACNLEYSKSNGKEIPADDGSVDILLANSNLHHLYDLQGFARECNRVIRPGGYLIITHEPNGGRNLPLFGKILYYVAHMVFRPGFIVFALVDRMPLLEKLLRSILSKISKTYRKRNRMLSRIAEQLKAEGLTSQLLRGVEVQQYVDFQSQYGFTKSQICNEVFTGFDLQEWITYRHLNTLTHKNKITEYVSKVMMKWWPNDGMTIGFSMKKKS